MSGGTPALPKRDDFSLPWPSHEYALLGARSQHTARPPLVHHQRAALSARAARPLLPDARLLRGVRGSRPGNLPARVAPASDVRRPLLAPRLALQDRDKRLPGRPRQRPRNGEVLWLQPYPDELVEDVVRIVDGKVADIVTFDGSVFPWFGLPESL